MSILKDLNESHISIKSVVLSLLVIMPFWFVAIFLFHRVFFNSVPIYIPIVFSFCFSLINFAMAHALISWINDFSKLNKQRYKSFHSRTVFISTTATVYSVVGLSIFVCVGFIFKWDFYQFLKWTFIPLGIICVFGSFIEGIFSEDRERKLEKKGELPFPPDDEQ
ncbi:MAG: hypothetical protein ACYDCN_09040 [Bacteroidia bacterium]